MKKQNWLITLAACVIFILLLAGCSGSSTGGTRSAIEEASSVVRESLSEKTPEPTRTPKPTPFVDLEDGEWIKDDGEWYYNLEGENLTGWLKLDEGTYYLDDSGIMQTGWVEIKGHWYFFESNGLMKTGWLDRGGYWYYLKDSGIMAESETMTIDGEKYSFDGDGHMIEEEAEKSDDMPSKQSSGGVTPEFKAAMDSYEAFFDEYCDFLKAMDDDPSNFTFLMEYAEMMLRYADTMDKLDAIDEDELSDADLAYYIEVMARINKKLIEIAYYMD